MVSASRIYVAGADTIVGRAICRRLGDLGFANVNTNGEPNLRDRTEVRDFLARSRPDCVFVTAGRTAGIAGNQQAPADLMIDNLLVAAHVIPAAWEHGVTKLLYLASSCTYPKLAPQPLHVESLWTGAVEPTSAAYAVSKLAGMTLCDAYRRQHAAQFITAIGADVYGPGDDFSADNSHVVAALIRRFHEARVSAASEVAIWGSGTPCREFIYVDDLADACVFAMRHYDEPLPLNLGTGTATSIAELAREIAAIVGYTGALTFDRTKPDGMPFKGLDSSRVREMGWQPRISLADGLRSTYKWFLAEQAAQC
jgi:GDP-L-fucose synthase